MKLCYSMKMNRLNLPAFQQCLYTNRKTFLIIPSSSQTSKSIAKIWW